MTLPNCAYIMFVSPADSKLIMMPWIMTSFREQRTKESKKRKEVVRYLR
jgi:hypothetical protein